MADEKEVKQQNKKLYFNAFIICMILGSLIMGGLIGAYVTDKVYTKSINKYVGDVNAYVNQTTQLIKQYTIDGSLMYNYFLYTHVYREMQSDENKWTVDNQEVLNTNYSLNFYTKMLDYGDSNLTNLIMEFSFCNDELDAIKTDDNRISEKRKECNKIKPQIEEVMYSIMKNRYDENTFKYEYEIK